MTKKGYFYIQELVPERVYSERGSKAWQLIDPRLIDTLNACRELLGPMTVNNWHSASSQEAYGRIRTQSGLRDVDHYKRFASDEYGGVKNYAASYSQHKYGRAADFLCRDHTAEEARAIILANLDKLPHLKGLEEGVSWVHIDVRNSDELVRFRP